MKKILVVEDEPTLREGIVTAFNDRGWHVSAADDGSQALSQLESEIFDVVVTDYKMPCRDGIDVLKRARLVDDMLPVVMMTAKDTQKDRFWGLAGRLHYTLVTVAAVAFVWFLNYWNLLGWRF